MSWFFIFIFSNEHGERYSTFFFFFHALALDGIRNVYIQEQIIFNQVIKNNKTYMKEG